MAKPSKPEYKEINEGESIFYVVQFQGEELILTLNEIRLRSRGEKVARKVPAGEQKPVKFFSLIEGDISAKEHARKKPPRPRRTSTSRRFGRVGRQCG